MLHGCVGAPRRGIARGHLGDGGHDADAPDLPAQRRQLPAALPESGVQGQGDEAHLPGGGGQQPGDHYPYGGERVVSAEQTPRKGMIWSRMTASAVAIGARLKGCDLTEPRGAGLRVQGSAAVICPLLLGDTVPKLAVTSVRSRALRTCEKWRNGTAASTTASPEAGAWSSRHFS